MSAIDCACLQICLVTNSGAFRQRRLSRLHMSRPKRTIFCDTTVARKRVRSADRAQQWQRGTGSLAILSLAATADSDSDGDSTSTPVSASAPITLSLCMSVMHQSVCNSVRESCITHCKQWMTSSSASPSSPVDTAYIPPFSLRTDSNAALRKLMTHSDTMTAPPSLSSAPRVYECLAHACTSLRYELLNDGSAADALTRPLPPLPPAHAELMALADALRTANVDWLRLTAATLVRHGLEEHIAQAWADAMFKRVRILIHLQPLSVSASVPVPASASTSPSLSPSPSPSPPSRLQSMHSLLQLSLTLQGLRVLEFPAASSDSVQHPQLQTSRNTLHPSMYCISSPALLAQRLEMDADSGGGGGGHTNCLCKAVDGGVECLCSALVSVDFDSALDGATARLLAAPQRRKRLTAAVAEVLRKVPESFRIPREQEFRRLRTELCADRNKRAKALSEQAP